MEIKQTKYQNTEKKKLKRSQIKFADYNPRKISEKALRELKKNIKKIKLLGGVVVNIRTMNIVSGHQRIAAIDSIDKYNPKTKENDYLIEVECIDVDEQTEKEQNIFMNSTTVQGEFDNVMLAEMLPDIDYKHAGLDEYDLSMIQAEAPQYMINNDTDDVDNDFKEIEQEIEKEKSAEQKKAEIKEAKKAQKERIKEDYQEGEPYFIVTFTDFEAKAKFSGTYQLDPHQKYISGEELFEKIQ